MFGRKSKTTAYSAPSHPDDNWRLKSTGQRVTILRRLGNGDVKVAADSDGILREDIVSARDITRA
ncbi:hypothetical protein ACFVIY_17820 [Streptomyces sp. NPDC127166]|uniref:hypothetical protein n=1 Tax=Streptomyces sp. NPDC127166 TaxID=3345380 RepID=UPI00362C4AAC